MYIKHKDYGRIVNIFKRKFYGAIKNNTTIQKIHQKDENINQPRNWIIPVQAHQNFPKPILTFSTSRDKFTFGLYYY